MFRNVKTSTYAIILWLKRQIGIAMKLLLIRAKKYLLNRMEKIKSPLLLSASIILVIKVFEFLWPETFSSIPIWILKITLYMISSALMGFTAGRLQAKGKLMDYLFRTVFLTMILVYITPSLIGSTFGMVFVTVAWILAVYWIEIDIVQFIKEINKVPSSKKEITIQAIKYFAEFLTFTVAFLELLNLFIPLITKQ